MALVAAADRDRNGAVGFLGSICCIQRQTRQRTPSFTSRVQSGGLTGLSMISLSRLNLIQGPYDDDVGEEEAGGCSKGSRVSDIATRFESLGRVQEPLVTISASADTDICQTEIHHEDLTIASAVKSSIPEPSADIIFSNCSGDFLLLQHNRLVSN